MAKIAYVGIPLHGHTNPILPVIRELAARGHRVVCHNAEAFRAKLAAAGGELRAYPEPMPTERELSETVVDLIDGSLLFARMSLRLSHHVVDELRRERPDVIVYDSACMWGYLAGRTLGIPHICVSTTFVLHGLMGYLGAGAVARLLWSAVPHLGTLAHWKWAMVRDFGKAAGKLAEYADRNLVFTSREFHPPNRRIDDRFRFVGASLDPGTCDRDFPFELLGERPLVYISLGTIGNLDPAFYRTAFEAFRDLPAQFVLSAGKHTDLRQLGEAPANFIVRPHVPQLEILQRARAFVTHGGMNSVHEALVYGVPLVVVPRHFEELANGKRVAETETGVLFGAKPPYGRVTPAALRRALDEVLHEPRYRQNAARYGRSLIDAGGYRKAADEIEAWIAGRDVRGPERRAMPS